MSLQTRFGLVLGAVLFVATLLPLGLLYVLGVSGLVEAAYVSETQGPLRADEILPVSPFATPSAAAGASPPSGTEAGPGGGRVPTILRGPETAFWIRRLFSDPSRVVVTSPVFRFRADLPAWLALGSVPVLGLMLGFFLSVMLSRSVTRPVSRLAEAARSIGRRDLGYRVEAEGSRELRELAESFNRMAGELERAELVRRDLTADIAHELRTPLTVLDGNLRALLDEVRAPTGDEIALLYEQTRHLNRLVGDLNDLSLAEARQLTLDRRAVDLARLAEETAAHFEHAAREQELRLSLDADGPLVHPALDENRIRQILHNLLANALRHTPRGGSVELSVRPAAAGKTLEILVADSGSGIAPEDLPRVFDRFYRSAESPGRDRGGAGLGLAIVKALVEAHGGTITARSEGRDRGSVFTITLPCEPGSVQAG
jgi:signal transduction histidine kinase